MRWFDRFNFNVTVLPASCFAFNLADSFWHRNSSSVSSAAKSERSLAKVVSFEIDFVSRSLTTGRGSVPLARFITVIVWLPSAAESAFGSPSTRSWQVKTPIAFNRAIADLPTPYKTETGCGASHAAASRVPMTKNPSGLSRSDAILASDLVPLSPTETEMPMSRLISC